MSNYLSFFYQSCTHQPRAIFFYIKVNGYVQFYLKQFLETIIDINPIVNSESITICPTDASISSRVPFYEAAQLDPGIKAQLGNALVFTVLPLQS